MVKKITVNRNYSLFISSFHTNRKSGNNQEKASSSSASGGLVLNEKLLILFTGLGTRIFTFPLKHQLMNEPIKTLGVIRLLQHLHGSFQNSNVLGCIRQLRYQFFVRKLCHEDLILALVLFAAVSHCRRYTYCKNEKRNYQYL